MNRLFISFIALMMVSAGTFAAPIKAMILDGQNNHDWKATTPVLKKQLLDTDKFVVDVVTSPSENESLADFNPAFSKYDVIVLNYNGKMWNKNARENFVDYVRKGGGVVVVHAANNPFSKWEEYNDMIGIGGWGGRNKSSGPYCYWVDGKLVRDHDSDGPGGGHEGYGEFVVENRQPDHPVLKGMPAKWLQPDELYNFMRGPGQHMEVLATAYSASPRDKGGSGRHEPMIMTLTYGKGQIFHTTLGHNVGSIKSAGFKAIFTRGTEWVVTGQVTIPLLRRIPQVQSAVEALGELGELDSYVAFDAVLSEIGQAANNPAELKKIESVLIKHIKNSKTSFLALQATCNALGVAGTEKAIPALSELLAKDARHASIAGLALETIEGSEATDALMAELGKRKAINQVGIIHVLGRRRDAVAVDMLSSLATDENTAVKHAAINVLGVIANREALANLNALPDSNAKTKALINCAYTMFDEGNEKVAAQVFTQLLNKSDIPSYSRTVVLRGLLMADPASGMKQVWALLGNENTSTAALNILASVPGSNTLADDIVGQIGRSGQYQSIFIKVAADRNMVEANSALLKVARYSVDSVRIEAYDALSVLAGPQEYETLIKHALSAEGEVQEAAVNSVIQSGRKVVSADKRIAPLKEQLSKALSEYQRSALLPVLTDIGGAEALKLVDEHARHESVVVQKAAFRELGRWKSTEALGTILALAEENKDSTRRGQLMEAFSGLLSGAKDMPAEKKIVQIRKALSIGLDVEGKRALLKSLSTIKDGEAFDIANALAKESALAVDAKRAALALKQKLMTAPTLAASHGNNDVAKAMDNNPETCWSTGSAMKPGMWFRIDLHKESDIYGLTLDTKNSKGDYPRGYEVYVSNSIDYKGKLVAGGSEKDPIIQVDFKEPVRGRYIKIVQTGSDRLWWSIHELNVIHDPGLEKIPAPKVLLSKLLSGHGMIEEWNVAGPFMESGTEGVALYSTKFAPEVDTRMASWTPLDTDLVNAGIVNFVSLFGGNQRVAYLNTNIVTEKAAEVTLGLGADDAVMAWVNGSKVFSKDAVRPISKNSKKVKVNLQKGENDVLVKIVNYRGNWHGYARIF